MLRYRALLCIVLACFTFLTIFAFIKLTSDNISYDDAEEQSLHAFYRKNNAKPVILLWNAFFGDKRWELSADTMTLKCPLAKCFITNERNYLPRLIDYDAVVFHTARHFEFINSVPNERHPSQLYVFAQLESPEHTWHRFSNERAFYNLTMTYRLDSDILWSYGRFVDNGTNTVVAPALNPNWGLIDDKWTQTDTKLLSQTKNKTKFAAWFVSNCKTPSRREKLVKELQKYIDVDIYGKCGDFSCERGSTACDDLLDNDYKFYFSFENSLCTDYVTEKFYNALQHNVIPVVFGKANYASFAPPQSYVDAQSFERILELVHYLKYLAENPLVYVKYFWWKRYYTVESFINPPFCDLCEHIQMKSTQYRTQYYGNIDRYWNAASVCQNSTHIKF